MGNGERGLGNVDWGMGNGNWEWECLCVPHCMQVKQHTYVNSYNNIS